jgi:hypothetical protein
MAGTLTMSKQYIRPGDRLLASMTTPENPELGVLEDMIFAAALVDEDDRNDDALGSLLRAHWAVMVREHEEDDAEIEVDLVSDGHKSDRTWAAEKLYKRYVLKGYCSRQKVAKDFPVDELYDYVSWYAFPSDWTWPAALLARVAYARGIRDALQSQALSRYFTEHASA